jgi:hypothetical protein
MEDVYILALPQNEKPSILRIKGNKLPCVGLRMVDRHLAGHSRVNLRRFAAGDNFTMKRLIAISLALLLMSASPLLAGSRGFGGSKRSFRPSTPPRTLQKPVQPKTGTVKDLGVNPTSKSPIDSVKGRSATTPGPVAGAGAPQAAPAPSSGFFGSGWFGSSWMNWAILGYLFGRHTAPTSEEARMKEREKAKKAEEAKQKEQAKEKEEIKGKEQDTKKEQIKETDELKSKDEPKDQTRPAAPTDSRQGI